MKEYEINLKLSGDLNFTLSAENLKKAKEQASYLTNQLIWMIKDNRPKIESLKLIRDRGDIRVDHVPISNYLYTVKAPVKGDLNFTLWLPS